jgi:glucuronoarabinoxylan endo-1,4-beta-xylanase
MKTILKVLSFVAVITAIPVFAQPACNIGGSYDMNTVVARPTFSCSQGAATNPQFEISGPGNSNYTSVANWNNNTNQTFGIAGNNRSVRMVSITCDGTVQNTTVACGSINIIDPDAVVVTPGEAAVNLSKEAQVIRGFGGMNYPAWTGGDLTAEQRETAFGNGSNQLGFTILRIHVDADRNSWQREVATAQKAIERGAIVFASPWVAPAGMNETFYRDAQNPNATRIKKSSYADYAKHLNDFVQFMKQNGVDLYAISVQNEPDYAHDWTWWTSAEIIDFLINHAPSIDCRIMAPESFQYRKDLSDPILNNAEALANMDILGVHMYGTPPNQYAYPLFKQKGAGKELWMTEVYYPNSDTDADVWPQALDVADHIHRNLADAEFQAYVWWYIRRSYGPIKEDGNISKRGYMMAHFSKFIRPGYIRVDATKTPNTDVFVSAYKGDGKVVIVAVNKQASNVNQNFLISGNASIEKIENWQTSQNENLAKKADIAVTEGRFTANLPAKSVTTFVGTLPVAPSSSSLAPGSSSSGTTHIITQPLNPKIKTQNPAYFTLLGEPLGSAKPQKAGVYILKQGSSIRKVMVR